jgi:hypothetical protein
MSALYSRSIFAHSIDPTSAALIGTLSKDYFLPVKGCSTVGVTLIENSEASFKDVF